MPSGLIHEQNGVGIGRGDAGYFREVQVHCRRVAPGQNETGRFCLFGTTGAEEIGRSCALVAWGRRPGSAFCAAPRDPVLLADTGFVLKPDFFPLAARRLARDFCHKGGEFFLKVSMVAPSRA